MKPAIGWGIIGCGDVTEVKSGPGFQKADHSSLVAVMRRNGDLAKDYARRHGVDLLARIHAEWPGTVRVLLSGWADLASITRAGTVAHRYLLKPCDAERFQTTLSARQSATARTAAACTRRPG